MQTTALGYYDQDHSFEKEDGLMIVIGTIDFYIGSFGQLEDYVSLEYRIEAQNVVKGSSRNNIM